MSTWRAKAEGWLLKIAAMEDPLPQSEAYELARDLDGCAQDLDACREDDDRQLVLGLDTPSAHRVRALAGVLAGFRWPDRGSFEALTKPQRAAARRVAKEALTRLGGTP